MPSSPLPQLGSAILEAVEQNTLSVEPVGFQPLPVVKASAVECGGPKWARAHTWTQTHAHTFSPALSFHSFIITSPSSDFLL